MTGPRPLPRRVVPKAPPIEMQGIETKIAPSIRWSGDGRWIEPFLGSGAVALNIAPRRAALSDANPHVIALYRGIQQGDIDGASVRAHLEREGAELLRRGEEHYYAVRDRFNDEASPLDFIFLNRSCFNGSMRFNRRGRFNTPFCRKPERFRPALVTKIANQVEWARAVMSGKDWRFAAQDWRAAVAEAGPGDTIYCDPPYIGRRTDYYNGFSAGEADELAAALIATPAGFALSMWLENKYRWNDLRRPAVRGFPATRRVSLLPCRLFREPAQPDDRVAGPVAQRRGRSAGAARPAPFGTMETIDIGDAGAGARGR